MRAALFMFGVAIAHSAYGMDESTPKWKTVAPLVDPNMPPIYITFERFDMSASRLGTETGPTAVFRLHNNTSWALGVLSVVLETSADVSNFRFVKVTNGSVRAVKDGGRPGAGCERHLSSSPLFARRARGPHRGVALVGTARRFQSRDSARPE